MKHWSRIRRMALELALCLEFLQPVTALAATPQTSAASVTLVTSEEANLAWGEDFYRIPVGTVIYFEEGYQFTVSMDVVGDDLSTESCLFETISKQRFWVMPDSRYYHITALDENGNVLKTVTVYGDWAREAVVPDVTGTPSVILKDGMTFRLTAQSTRYVEPLVQSVCYKVPTGTVLSCGSTTMHISRVVEGSDGAVRKEQVSDTICWVLDTAGVYCVELYDASGSVTATLYLSMDEDAYPEGPTALAPPASERADSTGGSLDNFTTVNVYTAGQYADVKTSDWSSENIARAYELGLMQGNADGTFGEKSQVTVAQAIAMAARLHRIYTNGTDDLVQGSVWYQVYVDYALENGILAQTYYNYNAAITRKQFAAILSAALPSQALEGINAVADGAIPDVSTTDEDADAIYTLDRAGVLTGGVGGWFQPNSNISREEAAAIVTRMADRTLRKTVALAG